MDRRAGRYLLTCSVSLGPPGGDRAGPGRFADIGRSVGRLRRARACCPCCPAAELWFRCQQPPRCGVRQRRAGEVSALTDCHRCRAERATVARPTTGIVEAASRPASCFASGLLLVGQQRQQRCGALSSRRMCHVLCSPSACGKGPAASAGLTFLTSDAAPCHRAGCDQALCSRRYVRGGPAASTAMRRHVIAPDVSRTVQPQCVRKRLQRHAVVPEVTTHWAAVSAGKRASNVGRPCLPHERGSALVPDDTVLCGIQGVLRGSAASASRGCLWTLRQRCLSVP